MNDIEVVRGYVFKSTYAWEALSRLGDELARLREDSREQETRIAGLGKNVDLLVQEKKALTAERDRLRQGIAEHGEVCPGEDIVDECDQLREDNRTEAENAKEWAEQNAILREELAEARAQHEAHCAMCAR